MSILRTFKTTQLVSDSRFKMLTRRSSPIESSIRSFSFFFQSRCLVRNSCQEVLLYNDPSLTATAFFFHFASCIFLYKLNTWHFQTVNLLYFTLFESSDVIVILKRKKDVLKIHAEKSTLLSKTLFPCMCYKKYNHHQKVTRCRPF